MEGVSLLPSIYFNVILYKISQEERSPYSSISTNEKRKHSTMKSQRSKYISPMPTVWQQGAQWFSNNKLFPNEKNE